MNTLTKATPVVMTKIIAVVILAGLLPWLASLAAHWVFGDARRLHIVFALLESVP